MVTSTRSILVVGTTLFVAGLLLGSAISPWPSLHAQSKARVFELRTYTAPEGKLPNLNARFREHAMRIFDKHGMTSIGYWTPQDAPASQSTLVYLIAHADREAAERNWKAFREDPEWEKVSRESQVDGKIVSKVESVFLEATDYSPLK